ncbi:MAG: PAS domain S-box protein, partial [Dehalococcoidia bacterium]
MSTRSIDILLIEDVRADRRLIQAMLAEGAPHPYSLQHADSLSAAMQILSKDTFDLVLLDLSLPDSEGLDTLNAVYSRIPVVPVVVLTGLEDEALGAEAVRRGAQDYLLKSDLDEKLLWRVIYYAIEREKKEAALRDSEEKYKSIVNNVKLGIFRTTPEPQGRFVEVNPAMEDITGYSREELLQMDPADLYLYPDERARILDEILAGQGKATRDVEFKRKDGTRRVASDTTVAVRDEAGRVVYFDGMLEDITERRRMEDEVKGLYEAEKEERRNLEEEARSRGQFINVLGHELRTPLNPALMSARMLRDALSHNPGGTEFRLVEIIQKSLETLALRLDDLRDLARFSQG